MRACVRWLSEYLDKAYDKNITLASNVDDLKAIKKLESKCSTGEKHIGVNKEKAAPEVADNSGSFDLGNMKNIAKKVKTESGMRI